MDFDLVVANGTVIDGTGRARFLADVGIRDGRVTTVATGERLVGRRTLDATGLVVAPGFVDVHSHVDWVLPLPDHDQILAPLLFQGITTVVTGNCGFSLAPVSDESVALLAPFIEFLSDQDLAIRWHSMADFLDQLDRDGLLLNAAFLVGHGTLRYAVMGARANTTARPTRQDLIDLCRLVRRALRDGAFGLSSGLAYVPEVFACEEDLLPLLRVVAEEGGIFTVHGRAYSWVSYAYPPLFIGTPHNVRSTRELLALACAAGVRLQLSHLVFVGRHTWPTHRTVLRDVERATDAGLDVAFDAFPYTVGNSTATIIFPRWVLAAFPGILDDPWALRRLELEMTILRWTVGIDYPDIRLLKAGAPRLTHLEGLTFSDIAHRLGTSGFEAYVHVARISQGKARVLMDTYSGDARDERVLRHVLAHPLCAFMTDVIISRDGFPNPATFGAYPRLLGRYSRDLGLFSLEEAVRRMTSFPAERIGLTDVGRIAEGYAADLVVFDPETVADRTTLDRPDTPPVGIAAVLLSGQIVARDGVRTTGQRHGRILRR